MRIKNRDDSDEIIIFDSKIKLKEEEDSKTANRNFNFERMLKEFETIDDEDEIAKISLLDVDE